MSDQMNELFSCHYESWMLLVWMWHPKYTASAARAHASILGIEGCTPSGDSSCDEMFKRLFDEDEDNVFVNSIGFP